MRWSWWRAVFHRGWWLVTSVYLILDAHLTPAQLVLIGAAQAAIALAFEVPAGVLADTFSRKWSLVVSQALMGTSMVATACVTDFGAIVATQMLWGVAWTFASGADVAWITDESADPQGTAVVLARSGRARLTGAAAGIAGFGALPSVIGRAGAMALAGAGMLLLGVYVLLRFHERRFVAVQTRRWSASWSILRQGLGLVRASRAVMLMFAATFVVNVAAVAFGRLQTLRLIEVGFPAETMIWFAGLGIVTLLSGAIALRVVERRVHDGRVALISYGIACAVGIIGLAGFAFAPEPASAAVAVILVGGIALPLTRTVATIWVNQQITDRVRATVHSLLAQAEYAGVILGGSAVAAVAGSLEALQFN